MGFLPTDYEPPQTGNYMRLQIGDNRFRILGAAIVGHMFWQTDNSGNRRPVRRRMDEDIEEHEIEIGNDGKPERVKHFWAFPVWNGHQVQILEITQRTVQDALRSLDESPDWGDPAGYDVTVTRKGSGLDTEYAVLPAPKAPMPQDATAAYAAAGLDLDLLFSGDDPFGAATAEPDAGPNLLTYDQAVSVLGAAGVSKAAMHDRMKADGLTKWDDATCSPVVAKMLEEVKPAHVAVGEDEIPF